jgi:hypothetical protein
MKHIPISSKVIRRTHRQTGGLISIFSFLKRRFKKGAILHLALIPQQAPT